jgi:4-hydroxybenzoate polyprenyltransferase
MSETVRLARTQRVRDLVRCLHPKQATVCALLVGLFAGLDGRPLRESASAGAAMLLVQLSLGLDNDLADAEHDYRSETPGKPIAEGLVERATASYWMAVLILVAVPVSMQNGAVAGGALLLTLPLGWLHNHLLHRTALSFVGWAGSFALVPAFLAYGGWAGGLHGSAPTWAITAAAALAGVAAHLVTSMGDLVADNKSGARNLPLRIALRLGAPRLLLVTIATSAAAVAALAAALAGAGLRR